MSDRNPKTDPAPNTNTVKDPDDWTTGEEPMTGAQASYLKTLSEKTGAPYETNLSKAEASKRIDTLRGEAGLAKTGRANPRDTAASRAVGPGDRCSSAGQQAAPAAGSAAR